MFQFGRFAYIYDWSSTSQVSPFGNHRINSYLLIPSAYRSLSRPSSPLRAKASPVCSYLLSSLHSLLRLWKCFFWLSSSLQYTARNCLLLAFLRSNNVSIVVCSSFLTSSNMSQNFSIPESIPTSYFCTFYIRYRWWWRITESNRWPPACKAGALASWANPP